MQAAWLKKEDVMSWSHTALFAYSMENLAVLEKDLSSNRYFSGQEDLDRQQWHNYFGYCHKNVISSDRIWAAKEDTVDFIWVLTKKTGHGMQLS